MKFRNLQIGFVALLLCLSAFATDASAQSRTSRTAGQLGSKLVNIKVGEVTLESINFRDQTARLNVGLDVANSVLPVSLKDFSYRLSLYNLEAIEGQLGAVKVGGRTPSRVNLPVTVNLRSIPGVLWSAFSNNGRVQYQLDAGFTLPLYVFERRFDQSFSGEVPLRSLVDAASLLRARRSFRGF